MYNLFWADAITDRTLNDVNYVKELNSKFLDGTISEDEIEKWKSDLKGALNTSDLERIENNIKILSDVLELDLTTHVGNIPQFPDTAYFANLRNNVQAIRNSGYILPTTPQVPQSPLNIYWKWNDIETILMDVYGILTQNFYMYCNDDVYCGEGNAILI